jgi:nucleotide-binding universal stress UspA family protein
MSNPQNIESAVQPILVAVDFGEAARAALLSAARLAISTGAPLKILHVVHDPGEEPNCYERKGDGEAIMPIADLAARRLQEFVLETHIGNPDLHVLQKPDTLLVCGLPATRIPEVASLVDAGRVVMGHTKAKGIWDKLFASLSERIDHSCGVPVNVVYAEGEAAAGAEARYRGSRVGAATGRDAALDH